MVGQSQGRELPRHIQEEKWFIMRISGLVAQPSHDFSSIGSLFSIEAKAIPVSANCRPRGLKRTR